MVGLVDDDEVALFRLEGSQGGVHDRLERRQDQERQQGLAFARCCARTLVQPHAQRLDCDAPPVSFRVHADAPKALHQLAHAALQLLNEDQQRGTHDRAVPSLSCITRSSRVSVADLPVPGGMSIAQTVGRWPSGGGASSVDWAASSAVSW